MKFAVGDRVVVVSQEYLRGSHGVVIEADPDQEDWPYRVDFDRHITLQPLRWVYNEDELEFETQE
jgi:hypothetical protein